jgi:hypothetical protein
MFVRISLLLLIALLSGCYKVSRTIEPLLIAPTHPKEIFKETRRGVLLPENFSISPFPPLTLEEAASEWGKEYAIALAFAEDFDLFRGITGFKRALFLLPCDCVRRPEIEYAVTLAYYLGKKYREAIYSVESSSLTGATETFLAYHDLLLILYDSYAQLGEEEAAQQILQLLAAKFPEEAQKLTLFQAVESANFSSLSQIAEQDPEHAYLKSILTGYSKEKKSIKKAEMLNAFLPGSGYYYVGLKKSAVTSFLLNALFIGAAVHFFSEGNVAAGAITLSLESGWYLGGIYGAGLAAKGYNEQLYCQFADKITRRETLFPLFRINYCF